MLLILSRTDKQEIMALIGLGLGLFQCENRAGEAAAQSKNSVKPAASLEIVQHTHPLSAQTGVGCRSILEKKV